MPAARGTSTANGPRDAPVEKRHFQTDFGGSRKIVMGWFVRPACTRDRKGPTPIASENREAPLSSAIRMSNLQITKKSGAPVTRGFLFVNYAATSLRGTRICPHAPHGCPAL